MANRFTERETGAEYFIRELSDGTIAWVGEHIPRLGELKSFTNVFLGRRISSSTFQGDFIDIPKGRASGTFLNLIVNSNANGFSFNLPGVGVRTLVRPSNEFPSTDSKEWGSGFYDEEPGSSTFSLTGVWRCNDGGSYYVRQFGSRVAWFGEHPSGAWSNIFFGQLTGSRVAGRWIDVPKGSAASSGEIVLDISGAGLLASRIPGTRLKRVDATGGFGGSEWTKTDSLRVAFRLLDLKIIRNADVGGLANVGGDEPYLMPLYITLGGNQYTDLAQLISESSPARPSVTSPLFQHEWGTRGDWPKNNLTWQEDLVPGTALTIPDYISYVEVELRTLPTLQPNSTFARDTSNFVPGVIAAEEASTRNEDIRAGYTALLRNSPQAIHQAITRGASRFLRGENFSINEIVNGVRDALTDGFLNAVKASAASDLFGIIGSLFDRDKSMGANFNPFSFGKLRDLSALLNKAIPVEMVFKGGANGEWRVRGEISATLAPSGRIGSIVQSEITFETGNDDKREDSFIEVNLQLANRTTRGPFKAHLSGQRFSDRSLHTFRIPIDPAIILSNQRELQIIWRRGPGNEFLRRPDSWELKNIRLTLFDRLGRRHVLLNNQSVNTKLEDNRILTVNLPRI